MSILSLSRGAGLAAGLLLALVSSAAAQPPGLPCGVALDRAQLRYTEQDYTSVEALVLACVSHPEASPAQVQQGYRLLALAFIRQDLLQEAQTTVLKLLGAGFDYEPDPVQDPPFYVALVASVKEQLRVTVPPAGSAVSEATLVNVNTATAAELEAVPGIGPVLAGRIVAHRDREGPFQRLDDLGDVQGNGPGTLERLLPYLTTEPVAWTYRAGGGVPAAPAAPEPVRPPSATPRAPAGALINLNTATAAELESLDGIGPALAGRIIAYREEVGPFRTVEEVLEVRGIGPRTLERFVDSVTVGGN